MTARNGEDAFVVDSSGTVIPGKIPLFIPLLILFLLPTIPQNILFAQTDPRMESVGILMGLEKAESAGARERLAQAAVSAGIYWSRQSFEWRVAETAPHAYDWAHFDTAMEVAERFGIQVLGLITTTPFGHAPASEEELDRFAHFVRSVVERYRDRVHFWEIWNEPNLGMFWGPGVDPLAYAAALRVGYGAAKEADPSCRVLGMCTLGMDTYFIRKVLESPAAPPFDILSVHPYRDLREIDLCNDRPDITMREDMRVLRNLLREFGRDVPIWFTEMGRNTSLATEGEGISLAAQAAYTVKMHVMAAMTGVEKLFQYELYAPPAAADNKEYHYGILHSDYSPKPAYEALRTMTAKLADLRYEGSVLAEDSFARGYLFGNDERVVLVLWAVKDQAEILLPVDSKSVAVTDLEGRQRTVTTPDGVLAVELTESPIFVEGFNRKAVRELCELSVALPWRQCRIREWSSVECAVGNSSAEFARWSLRGRMCDGGRVNVSPDHGYLESGKAETVALSIRPGSRTKPGDSAKLDLILSLTNDRMESRMVRKMVHIPVDPGWLICGPFPNPGPEGSRPTSVVPTDTGLFIDHLADAGGEAVIEPVEGQSHPGALGENPMATWKPHPLDQRGFIDFRHSFGVRRNATAYAYRVIHSPDERFVRMRIGSDDGIRIWLNHREVFQKHVHREAHIHQDEVIVPLKKGRNPCLIKVDQGGWGWGAYVQIEEIEPDGR
ncbi:MAG TPA: hypothetical protein PK395_13000 [bacterium]|nr:hypothetical protein [bacterium]HQQ00802.1 hypothetical protein [bacterium]